MTPLPPKSDQTPNERDAERARTHGKTAERTKMTDASTTRRAHASHTRGTVCMQHSEINTRGYTASYNSEKKDSSARGKLAPKTMTFSRARVAFAFGRATHRTERRKEKTERYADDDARRPDARDRMRGT